MKSLKENKGKILIVDDDKFILLSLEVLLKQYFEKVVVLQDPNLIPATLKSHTFDVAILDMNFEKGETSGDAGIFWLQKIKKNDTHTCVITITAYGEISKAVRTVKAGAMDFVVKPWENEKLLSTVPEAEEINFKIEIEPDITFNADHKMIEQVFMNIYKNAIEAYDKKQSAEIKTSAFLTTNNRLQIEISDNGPGMKKEIVEKIFIPFYTTKQEGSGIGLSLCRQIILAHHGHIKAESKEGNGTKVIILL